MGACRTRCLETFEQWITRHLPQLRDTLAVINAMPPAAFAEFTCFVEGTLHFIVQECCLASG
eukprot:2340536-Amphidinium_carterae.1